MKMADLRVGDRVRVVKLITADKLYRQKLMAMGVLPGTIIALKGIAPLGDPIKVEVRGMMLCLRKDEANIIQIEAV